MTAGWQGLAFQTADGGNTLQINAQLRADGRFAPGDQPAVTTTNPWDLRYVRVSASGKLARFFNYRVTPSFINDFYFTNAFVEAPFSPHFRVRAGKDRPQVGYELLQPDGNVLFLERGLPSSLLPNYDVGVQAIGETASDSVEYAAGLFTGVVDGTASHAPVNLARDGGPDLTGRFIVRPFAHQADTVASSLRIGIAGTAGRERGAALPAFKTSVQQRFFSYAPGVVADGKRTRFTPQVFYDYKSFGAFAEYARSEQMIAGRSQRTSVANQAWQVAAQLVVTGERSSTRIVPHHPFAPGQSGWGALQLAARYGELVVDQRAFDAGLADASASRQVKAATVGLVWYLTVRAKVRLNFERAAFFGGAPRPTEHTVLYRFQLDY